MQMRVPLNILLMSLVSLLYGDLMKQLGVSRKHSPGFNHISFLYQNAHEPYLREGKQESLKIYNTYEILFIIWLRITNYGTNAAQFETMSLLKNWH